jgi:Protein of unknown function DUF262/Protein of unknown function (DUF1524)
VAEGGGIQGLMALFSDVDAFEIPDFQRNYSWTESQVESFHRDVMYSNVKKLDHFLGSVILMKSPNFDLDHTYQVIDGQQRLTTIFIYICALRDRLMKLPESKIKSPAGGVTVDVLSKATSLIFSDPENGVARFRSNTLLRAFLNEYIFAEPEGRPALPKRHKYYTLALREAYRDIDELLNLETAKMNQDEQLRFIYDMISTFEKRLKLLKVVTNSYAESFDIFMTMNSRGLALGPSDLVKSLFMKHTAAGMTADQVVAANQDISAVWKELTDNIGDGDVDQFLRHYLVSTESEPVISKAIYRTVESKLSDQSQDLALKSRELLNKMNSKSTIYASLLKPETIEDPFIQDNCRMLHALMATHRIIYLVILDENIQLSLLQRRELSRIVEVLAVRWVLTSGNAQELENHFQQVCVALQSDEFDYEEVRTLLASVMPPDERVMQTFELDTTKTALVRSVLHRINRLVGDHSEMLVLDSSKMQVEHVAPASATEHWVAQLFPDATDDKSAEYSVIVEMWGNKTLLDKKINVSIGQLPFRDKCEGRDTKNWGGYKDTPLSITRELIDEQQWNTALIRQRTHWIRDCFLHIWSLEDQPQSVTPFRDWKSDSQNS